ncbi:sulfurtransferase [Gephyromycinifex aptenodytis]|uniref:sulfurtransferase n=1 Tax=Gephyromycinifex aptenodytis TaxID=2716227 RepID=UPI001446E197|nr:sulfurtransferase [Gephyromycinifex aptenodytis]
MPERPALISPRELYELMRRGAGDTPLLLDVRWALGADDGYDAYLQGHLPGAVFVDLERDLSGELAEDGTGGRHPMPTVDDFEIDMAECGVDNDRPVVCYDDSGSLAAARCWWLLRHFGKYDVQVLDGGLQQWRAQRLPIESGLRLTEEGDFSVRRGHSQVLQAEQATMFAEQGLLLDCRPADRFRGENEIIDPIAGHIPGAVSMPARTLTDEFGRFLPTEELRAKLMAVGVDGERPVATYCGSGVQASHVALAISVAGLGEVVPIYIGSWSDWITDPSRPIAIGYSVPPNA